MRRLGFQLVAAARRHQGDRTERPAHTTDPIARLVDTRQTVRNVLQLLEVVGQSQMIDFQDERLRAPRVMFTACRASRVTLDARAALSFARNSEIPQQLSA